MNSLKPHSRFPHEGLLDFLTLEGQTSGVWEETRLPIDIEWQHHGMALEWQHLAPWLLFWYKSKRSYQSASILSWFDSLLPHMLILMINRWFRNRRGMSPLYPIPSTVDRLVFAALSMDFEVTAEVFMPICITRPDKSLNGMQVAEIKRLVSIMSNGSTACYTDRKSKFRVLCPSV